MLNQQPPLKESRLWRANLPPYKTCPAHLLDAEEANVLVPHRHLAISGLNVHVKQPLGQAKEALQRGRARQRCRLMAAAMT